jgi:hypothetical protein
MRCSDSPYRAEGALRPHAQVLWQSHGDGFIYVRYTFWDDLNGIATTFVPTGTSDNNGSVKSQ